MSEKINILIVDDEKGLINAFLRYLIMKYRDKYDAFVCDDGSEAIELLKNNKIDILITDFRMPNCNGFELCNQIKKDQLFKNLPIIITSGFIDDTAKDNFNSIGIKHFIQKPYDVDILFDNIKTILEEENNNE